MLRYLTSMLSTKLSANLYNDAVAWANTEADKLATTYAAQQHGAPHPECNLISYLRTQRGTPTPPLRYIGLSVPCCAPCVLWIQNYPGYARPYNYRLSFRGHSGILTRWGWPWVSAPGTDERRLAKSIADTCVNYLRAKFTSGDLRPCYLINLHPLELDPPLLKELIAEMSEWWMENDGACVFGCMVADGCCCFSLLWGP